MSKKCLVITLLNILCLFVVIWNIPHREQVKAQGQNQFLGPIYYNSVSINSVFDHDLPINNPFATPDPDGNTYVMHYNGTIYPAPVPNDYRYDGHEGIDYGLTYKEVIAATDGDVIWAGWDNPSDHTDAYGLLIVIEHGNGYRTYYGHLSVVLVRDGDTVIVDRENWQGIIAISSSTGNSSGPHLHFSVRNTANIIVNPYGWIGLQGGDPWANHNNGNATSMDLWVAYPSITNNPPQFTNGEPVNRPVVNSVSNFVIDDSSADFYISGSCWIAETAGDPEDSFNGTYYWAIANDDPNCEVEWRIKPDAFSPPGLYDVFVYIPKDASAALDSLYTINYNGVTAMAEVVQFHYHDNQPFPPPPHVDTSNPWAYIGRYEFAMDGTETIQLNDDVPATPPYQNNHVLVDAIKLVAVEDVQPSASTVYYSWMYDGIIGDVAEDQANIITYANEDIVAYDALNGTWSIYFDGSDVGLAAVNVDAFTLLADGSILLSIDEPLEKLDPLENVDDSDIVRFIPTSTGQPTSGSFELYLDGSDFGLDDPSGGPDRDIDAIGFIPDGELLISTTNDLAGLNVGYFSDEDLVYWDPTGVVPAWVIYFDGSDVGLATEEDDVNGVWVAGNGQIFLTMRGAFDTTTLSGDGADIFICDPETIGPNTVCTYLNPLSWNGSAHGINTLPEGTSVPPYYPPLILDGFSILEYIAPPSCGTEPMNCSFEDGLNHWTIENVPYPNNAYWYSTDIDAYTGQYSAMLSVTNIPTGNPRIVSSIFPVEPATHYVAVTYVNEYDHNITLDQGIIWFLGNNETLIQYIDIPEDFQAGWHNIGIGFCSIQGAIGVQLFYELENIYDTPANILIDHITVYSYQGCPVP